MKFKWVNIPMQENAEGIVAFSALMTTDNSRLMGWVSTKSAKLWMAWEPPKLVPGTAFNLLRDGRFLGLYPTAKEAMEIVRVKTLPPEGEMEGCV